MRHQLISLEERCLISNFKSDLSARLRAGKVDIEGAIVEVFTFYSRQNLEEPPFILLKMAEAAVNSTYQAKVNFLRQLKIM